MDKWKKLADIKTVNEVINALKERNIEAFFVENKEEAKNKVLEMIPEGQRALTSTSVTLEEAGIKEEIDNSGRFISVRKEYMGLSHDKDAEKIRQLRSTPDVMVGSVHAITESGEIIVASNTGSQLAGYSYGAFKLIIVVGTQKIVKDMDEAIKRLYEYVVPLEEKHMQDLYGVGTNVSKLLIINKETVKDRIKVIFVNEVLGF